MPALVTDMRERGLPAPGELDADWQLTPELAAPEQVWRLALPPPGWEGVVDTA